MSASPATITATSWTPDVKYPGARNLYDRLKLALEGGEPSYHAAEAYMALMMLSSALPETISGISCRSM